MNKDGVVLVGRVLIAVLFILAGFGKLMGFDGAVKTIAGAHIPMPEVAAVITIIIELGGGILLVLGWKARWAALAIAVFTVIASFIFHAFWSVPADQVMMQRTDFLKNLSIIGGLLFVFAYGPGRLSVDKG
jgi:putative oxidoreductase